MNGLERIEYDGGCAEEDEEQEHSSIDGERFKPPPDSSPSEVVPIDVVCIGCVRDRPPGGNNSAHKYSSAHLQTLGTPHSMYH